VTNLFLKGNTYKDNAAGSPKRDCEKCQPEQTDYYSSAYEHANSPLLGDVVHLCPENWPQTG